MASMLYIAASVLAVTACGNHDDTLPSYNLTINYAVSPELSVSNLKDLQLIIGNTTKADTLSLTDLSAKTVTLTQGQYTLTLKGKVIDEAQAYVSGTTSVDLYDDKSASISIDKILQSSLIFKTIYFNASKRGYMKEGFFEIVNNSDEVQYLDNIIIAAPKGNQKAPNAWQAAGVNDLYNSGQGVVLAFPGTGKDYPLKPGQSIVVANDAFNHKMGYGDDESQKEAYTVCPDLSKADWEVYLDYNPNDVDYPAPNLKNIFENNKRMFAFGIGVFGRSYIIAKLPEGITPEAFAANPINLQTTPGTTSKTLHLMIPSKYVLDAVDVYDPANDSHVPTFLPKDDATGVRGNTAYTGKCIRRKVVRIANNRPYYKDTNNSQEDFVAGQPNIPGITPTAID